MVVGAGRVIRLRRRLAPVRRPAGAPRRRPRADRAAGRRGRRQRVGQVHPGPAAQRAGRARRPAGSRVDGLDTRRDGAAVRRRVGFVFTDPDAQIVMPTVAEDVAFSLRRGLSRGRAGRAGRPRRWRGSGWPATPTIRPTCCPAARSSCWRWPRCWSPSPTMLVCDEPTTLLDLRNARVAPSCWTDCRSGSSWSPTTWRPSRTRPGPGRGRGAGWSADGPAQEPARLPLADGGPGVSGARGLKM